MLSQRPTRICRAIVVVIAVLGPRICSAQAPSVDDAATMAANANSEHCPDIYTENVEVVAQGYSHVALALETVQQSYDEWGNSALLYWRGVLAQCLGRDELALTDLNHFVSWTDGVDDEELAALVADAQQRIKRMDGGRAEPAPLQPLDRSRLERQRAVGVTFLVSGSLAAAGGFILNGAAYRTGQTQTEQQGYETTRSTGIAGLVIGLTGAGFGISGLLTLIATERSTVRLGVRVGPVTTLTWSF